MKLVAYEAGEAILVGSLGADGMISPIGRAVTRHLEHARERRGRGFHAFPAAGPLANVSFRRRVGLLNWIES